MLRRSIWSARQRATLTAPARASTTAWLGSACLPPSSFMEYRPSGRNGQTVETRGLTVGPEFLGHISRLGWAHILLTSDYRWPKRR